MDDAGAIADILDFDPDANQGGQSGASTPEAKGPGTVPAPEDGATATQPRPAGRRRVPWKEAGADPSGGVR